MYPFVIGNETYRRNYEGTVPFRNDPCYQYFKKGFLTDNYTHHQHQRLDFSLADSLYNDTGAFGSPCRCRVPISFSEYSYRYAIDTKTYGLFMGLILMSNDLVGEDGYWSGIIPTTGVILQNFGDSKVFDLPLKVKNKNGTIVANGTLKTRVALGIPNLSSLHTAQPLQGDVDIVIDTLFTGTKNSTSINPSLASFAVFNFSRRISEYDDVPVNSEINYYETNDIATCAYTQ